MALWSITKLPDGFRMDGDSGRLIVIPQEHCVELYDILDNLYKSGRAPNNDTLTRMWDKRAGPFCDWAQILRTGGTRQLTDGERGLRYIAPEQAVSYSSTDPEPKPPIGLRPLFAAEYEARQARMAEITAAVQRYMAAKLSVPIAWMEEYEELLRAIKKG